MQPPGAAHPVLGFEGLLRLFALKSSLNFQSGFMFCFRHKLLMISRNLTYSLGLLLGRGDSGDSMEF